MHKKIAIGNWKMNLSIGASVELARVLAGKITSSNCEAAVCPSFTALSEVSKALSGSQVALGAQDVFWEDTGAYTGEIPPGHLLELGCRYTLVGHSERRENLKETDEMIHNKMKSALYNDLTPVLCVGETYAERENGQTDDIVYHQVIRACLGIDLNSSRQIIVAYEPVWVIGSGRAIKPEEAERAFSLVYQALTYLWPAELVDERVRIIYGGSVDSKNAGQFVKLNRFGGFLIGGASLQADEFAAIIRILK